VLDSLYVISLAARGLASRAFHRLSRSLSHRLSVRSFTMRNLGSRLEDWDRRAIRRSRGIAYRFGDRYGAHGMGQYRSVNAAAERVSVPEDCWNLAGIFALGCSRTSMLAFE